MEKLPFEFTPHIFRYLETLIEVSEKTYAPENGQEISIDNFAEGEAKSPEIQFNNGAFWGITDDLYDSFLKDFKEKQANVLSKMQDHSDADEEFYLTANMVLSLAQRALPIFQSSEPTEKRQFLGFLLQNCVLQGKKLEFTMRSPFNLIANCPDDITMRRVVYDVRTYFETNNSRFFIPGLTLEHAKIS